MGQNPSRATSPIPNLSTETVTEKERASHSSSELCADLDSGWGDFGVGYTDEIPNVDATEVGAFLCVLKLAAVPQIKPNCQRNIFFLNFLT